MLAWEHCNLNIIFKLVAPLITGSIKIIITIAWLFSVAFYLNKQRSNFIRPIYTLNYRIRSEESKAVTSSLLLLKRRI